MEIFKVLFLVAAGMTAIPVGAQKADIADSSERKLVIVHSERPAAWSVPSVQIYEISENIRFELNHLENEYEACFYSGKELPVCRMIGQLPYDLYSIRYSLNSSFDVGDADVGVFISDEPFLIISLVCGQVAITDEEQWSALDSCNVK